MTNQELERQLRDWYAAEIRTNEPAPPALYGRLAVLSETAALGAPTPLYRRMSLLAAAALLAALAAGAVAVGSGIFKLPELRLAVVSPSPEPSQISATPLPSTAPAPSDLAPDGPAPWIAFLRHEQGDLPEHREFLWAMRSDGSDAHELAGGGPVAWSRDGTRLLTLGRAFPENGRILVAEVGSEIGPFVDTGIEEPTNEQWEAFDFAPDGERVVFMRKSKCASRSGSSAVVLAKYVAETAGENCHVLSVLNLRTGQVTDLEETLVNDSTEPGSLELPAWSPDGTKIAYTRMDQPERPDGARDLWVVNADGTNPSWVELAADVSVQEPRWSPDGTRISFTAERFLSDGVPATSTVYVAELATGRLDRITTASDQAPSELCCAEWLDDTHLRVRGGALTDPDRFWLVALDAVPYEAEVLVDLTESLAAIDAPGGVTTVSTPGDPGRTFFWQPVGEARP